MDGVGYLIRRFKTAGMQQRRQQAHREGGKGEKFSRARDVWGAPPSLKSTENCVPDGLFLT